MPFLGLLVLEFFSLPSGIFPEAFFLHFFPLCL
jgi:hypothetical protein